MALDASEMTSRIADLCDIDGYSWSPKTESSVRLAEIAWKIWIIYSDVYNGGLAQYFFNEGQDANHI